MTERDRVALVLEGPPGERSALSHRADAWGLTRRARRVAAGYRVSGEAGTLRAVEVGDPTQFAGLANRAPSDRPLLIRWTSDRVIPLENLRAARGREARIAVLAGSPDEVPAALGALEHGASLVIVPVATSADVDRLHVLLERSGQPTLRWRTARVVRTEPAGLSERVLVDTTRWLRPTQGLLVGSSAAFLFGVASEAHGSRFSAPRPFRINAGAPHSYILMADGTSRYLAELAPGDAVLVVEPRRPSSAARVGRLKIERRPMRLVAAEVGGTARTLFVQEAESVRLFAPKGPLPLPQVRAGDRLWGAVLPPGRHLGLPVDEAVEER